MWELWPFASDRYEMAMGIRPLGELPLVEENDARPYRLALKAKILADDHRYCFQTLPGSERAQAEAAEYLCRRLGLMWPSEDMDPLDAVGRELDADLLVLDGSREGVPLIAGQLCFPNDWCLDDKLGRSFLGVHEVVPGFAEGIGGASLKLLERMKPERPVWRLNWSIKPTDRLDLSPRYADWVNGQKQLVTAENAGDRCYFRIERQTLSRLPVTESVLFTVQTYVGRMEELAAEPERARTLAGVLRTVPGPMLEYKGIAPFVSPLLAYLDRASAV